MELGPIMSSVKGSLKSRNEVFSDNMFEWLWPNPVVEVEDLVVQPGAVSYLPETKSSLETYIVARCNV